MNYCSTLRGFLQLLPYALGMLVSCDRYPEPNTLSYERSGATTPVLGTSLRGAASLKDVQYVSVYRSGKSYLCFSAKIDGDPKELMACNSIHLTSVPGDDVLSFVSAANPTLGSGFTSEDTLSGSGVVTNSDQWLSIAVDPISRKCIGYIHQFDGR